MTFRITDQITANPYSANEKNLTDAVDTLTKALDIISGLTPKEAFDQTEPKEYTAPPKLNIKSVSKVLLNLLQILTPLKKDVQWHRKYTNLPKHSSPQWYLFQAH